MSLNCVIVDDNEIDRLMALSLVKRFPKLNVSGTFSSANEALPLISAGGIDVLFLDIDMPEMSGLELRKLAPEVPICIFITAHPEHAVESFELETLDFLVKPLRFDRLVQTVHRIEEFMEVRHKAALFESSIGGDAIFIKEGHEQIKVKLHDVLYLEAMKDYTLIVTSEKRHCVLSTIGNLLKEPYFESFVRIHRSFAVQKQFIEKIGTAEILLRNQQAIPVGRTYKDNLAALI